MGSPTSLQIIDFHVENEVLCLFGVHGLLNAGPQGLGVWLQPTPEGAGQAGTMGFNLI